MYDKKQTAITMKYLIRKFFRDLNRVKVMKNGRKVPITSLSMFEFFEVVKNIPYRRDTKPIEVISRPKHILKLRRLGMDCKKKALLIGSFLHGKSIPYRLVASSRKKNGRIHHVFPQAKVGNQWMNVDATYPHYQMFEPKTVTNMEVL